MLRRVGVLFVVAGCFVGLWGCVSADVYNLKEQEVQTLERAKADIQEQNISLTAEKNRLETRSGEMQKENEGLNARIEKQNEEIVYLKNRVEKLKKVGEGLRDRAEKLSAKITDLSKENLRLATLSRPENLLRSLGERLADLQKQVEVLSGENQKSKNKQVAARSEEEKTGGAEGKKTIKAAGEKPQPVRVSAGQKAEESKPDQQLEDEQELQALSEDLETPSDKP